MNTTAQPRRRATIVPAEGEMPKFSPGDRVRIGSRSPIAHYRVPSYVRGKTATVVVEFFTGDLAVRTRRTRKPRAT